MNTQHCAAGSKNHPEIQAGFSPVNTAIDVVFVRHASGRDAADPSIYPQTFQIAMHAPMPQENFRLQSYSSDVSEEFGTSVIRSTARFDCAARLTYGDAALRGRRSDPGGTSSVQCCRTRIVGRIAEPMRDLILLCEFSQCRSAPTGSGQSMDAPCNYEKSTDDANNRQAPNYAASESCWRTSCTALIAQSPAVRPATGRIRHRVGASRSRRFQASRTAG